MITLTFRFVATVLYNIATLLGMTYNEVNILAYYLLIPLTWTMMLDKYIGLPLTTGALLYIWIGIRIGTWGHFREWCDWAFMRSVDFLNYFNHWGGNFGHHLCSDTCAGVCRVGIDVDYERINQDLPEKYFFLVGEKFFSGREEKK